MNKTEKRMLSMLLTQGKVPFYGRRDVRAAVKLVDTIECIALERGDPVWNLVVKNRAWNDIEHWQEQARFIAEITKAL